MHVLIILFLMLYTSTQNPCVGAIPIAPQMQISYAGIVKRTAPAVVSISTTQAINMPGSLFSNDPFFNFFFGLNPDGQELQRQKIAKSLGSGVIIDPSGIVITCGHVVENAKKILVTLSDNREFEGEIIAKDMQNDLVAIQLLNIPPNTYLPSIALETNPFQVGDVILAIGNPFGVGQTITSGIISAAERIIKGRMLIQTDAPINPGNSGGALVSMNGNLIGIPNAILSRTGASHGIGFAIPEALIQILLDSIKNGGILKHPWLGINVQHITNDMAKSLGLQIPQGVLVTSMHPSSPAISSGIMQGDIISSVNGLNISTPEEFLYRIQTSPFGQSVTLTLIRNGQLLQIILQPIAPPEIPLADERIIPQNGDLLQGLKVANLSPALISKYQLPNGTPEKGVFITDVNDNLLSSELRLTKGDIIEKVNQQSVESVEGLFALFPIRISSITFLHENRHLEVNKGP